MGGPPQPWHGLPTLSQGKPPPDAAPARSRRGPRRRSSLPFADIKTVMSGRAPLSPGAPHPPKAARMARDRPPGVADAHHDHAIRHSRGVVRKEGLEPSRGLPAGT